MKYILIVLAMLASGLVWTRIFATPLYKLFGFFIKDRMTRLLMSGAVLVVLLCSARCMFSISRSAQIGILENIAGCLVWAVPCAALWVLLEYRYGGSYQDQRKRSGLGVRQKKK